MTAEIFVDVVGGISISAGLVRIELTARQPVEGETTGRAEVRQRVIMPIQGFLSTMRTLTEFAETRLAAGQSPAPAATGVTAGSRPPQSPNFR